VLGIACREDVLSMVLRKTSVIITVISSPYFYIPEFVKLF
jgi:hypothetical protein